MTEESCDGSLVVGGPGGRGPGVRGCGGRGLVDDRVVAPVSKHEPWHKPRDEDQDEALINWLGQKDPKYSSGKGGNGRNGGGCALLLIAAAGVAAAVGAAGAVVQHLT